MDFPGVLERPFVLWRGDTRTITIQVWDDDARTIPVDLTSFGSVYTAQARETPQSVDFIAFDTIDTTDAATGKIVLTISSDTSFSFGFAPARFGFDLSIEDTSVPPVRTTIVTGYLEVLGNYA